MISGVLFDLDGTLLDCIVPMEKILVDVLLRLGVRDARRKKVEVVKNLRSILLHGSSAFDGFRLLWRLGRHLGIGPLKRFVMILLAYRALRTAYLNPSLFPGTKKLLLDLKNAGISVAIVTTRSSKEASHVLKKCSIDSYFDFVVSRDLVKRGKPFPDPVLFALEKMGIGPDQAVMIGDMPTDIEAGRAAGTKTIGLAIGIFNEELKMSNPDAVAFSLEEIPLIIARL
ncbi:MAG: HAD family hydrolase [Candidatus Verstraetearchaeota archaeon]|nr:HAD family hydrolase [Candidatus Verstraetearchaeota archaeon]